ncbi:MAG: hypothetical protein OXI24_16555 [Candidatus Poribacteria bacterium]|nr:hypothetical protein [Candidatus Poribacteria bacterium]
MKFIFNVPAMERIEKNGTLVAPLSCCGQLVGRDRFCYECGEKVSVTLRGVRNPIRQTYHWQIFMGAAETEPVEALLCAYCNQLVTTANRQCACGAYCVLEFKHTQNGWELHRYVEVNETPTLDGIVIVAEQASTDRPVNMPPVDVSRFDLTLGELDCPFGHTFSRSATQIDANGCCTTHNVQMSAVLVFTDEGIFVERRAHYLSSGTVREIPPEHTRIAQLYCPACQHSIVDKTLLCSTCGVYIVDVVQKPAVDLQRQGVVGTDTHIFIEIAPRWAWDTTRPHNAIVMEGDNWEETEVPDETHATQTPTNDPMSYDTLFTEYIRLKTLGHGLRPAAEMLGISLGKLQYIIRKKKHEIQSTHSEPILPKYG